MQREKWLFEISPKNNLFDLNLKEVWQYRDLLQLFVKRDVVTKYKQITLEQPWYWSNSLVLINILNKIN